MRMIRRFIGTMILITPLVFSASVAAPSAFADSGCQSASVTGDQIATFVCLTVNGQPASPQPSSPINWTPPVCWLEPRYTPAGLQAYVAYMMNQPVSIIAEGAAAVAAWNAYYGGLTPAYNAGQAGWWWGVACNTTSQNILTADTYAQEIMASAGLTWQRPWEWVPTGNPAPAATFVATPELLADYAASAIGQLTLPKTGVSPTAIQTVNLPTYFAGAFAGKNGGKVTATASLPAFGMTSTVVASPELVTITTTGQTISGTNTITCNVNSSGKFGVMSKAGVPQASNCTFTYAQPGTYTITMRATWSINWLEANGAAGWPVEDLVPAQGQPAALVAQGPIQEIQTVNN